MPRPPLLWFLVLPLAAGLVLQAMYFSGVPALERIIVPRLEGMYGNTWREFGLVENLQNLLLLGIIVVAVVGLRRARPAWERAVYGLVALLAVFVFLEEIDYGLHWYEYLGGVPAEQAAETRNWHNEAGRNKSMKRLVDAGMVAWFLVLPLATARLRSPFVRRYLPGRWYALTVLAAWLLSELAHLLNDLGLNPDGMIRSNISEFREVNTYYIGLLYLVDLVYLRDRGPAREERAA